MTVPPIRCTSRCHCSATSWCCSRTCSTCSACWAVTTDPHPQRVPQQDEPAPCRLVRFQEPPGMIASDAIPTLDDIRAAAARIAGHARRTPVFTSRSLDELAGARLYFKCENLQRGGAFKFRGACNAVLSLDGASAARGVVTQASGNHGAAVALAAREQGIPATVVVPRSAPAVKLAAIRAFGAHVVPCEVAQADRDRVTAQVLARQGGTLVHPFNDARVIAGQGTATLELLEDVPGLDVLVAPVSGGGLLSGT